MKRSKINIYSDSLIKYISNNEEILIKYFKKMIKKKFELDKDEINKKTKILFVNLLYISYNTKIFNSLQCEEKNKLFQRTNTFKKIFCFILKEMDLNSDIKKCFLNILKCLKEIHEYIKMENHSKNFKLESNEMNSFDIQTSFSISD